MVLCKEEVLRGCSTLSTPGVWPQYHTCYVDNTVCVCVCVCVHFCPYQEMKQQYLIVDLRKGTSISKLGNTQSPSSGTA